MVRFSSLLVFFLLAPAEGAQPAAETHLIRDADGLNRALQAVRAGDRILLQPGDYRGNFYFRGVHGTAERPIVVGAADPAHPPHLIGKTICLQFTGASHLEIRDLELSGASDNGLAVDDADRADRPAHHITLRNVRVHNIGPKGNCDGIKLSGVADFLMEHCTVERWGDNGSAVDMVGCHRGLISDCAFRHGGFNALQIKGGSADVVVRGCRLEDPGERGINVGGFTGDAMFRPPLKAMPAQRKYEARNIRVEGCTFIGGQAAVAFAGVDGAVFRFNTIYRPQNYALRILQEKAEAGFTPCRDVLFQDNVIVFRSDKWGEGGVNVGPGTAPETFRFARNLWYCEDRPEQSRPKLPTPDRGETVGQDPHFRNPLKGDFRVPQDSPAAAPRRCALPSGSK